MKSKLKIAAINTLLFSIAFGNQVLAQSANYTTPGTLNNSSSQSQQDSILSYVMGWLKWIVILGIVFALAMTVFYFATGNQDKGKKYGIGLVCGICLWFFGPSILAAFGITITW